jgi:hypothetical protein
VGAPTGALRAFGLTCARVDHYRFSAQVTRRFGATCDAPLSVYGQVPQQVQLVQVALLPSEHVVYRQDLAVEQHAPDNLELLLDGLPEYARPEAT